jgi:hypothetical protein
MQKHESHFELLASKLGRIFVSFRYFSVSIHFEQIFVTETSTDTFTLSVFVLKKTDNRFHRILCFQQNQQGIIFLLIF